MMSAANVPEEYRNLMFPAATNAATKLDGLTVAEFKIAKPMLDYQNFSIL